MSGASGRAVAHIAVLEVLREHSIPIDYIVGCSSGALIAASFVIGTMDILKEFVYQLSFPKMLRLWSMQNAKGGLFHLNGEKMEATLNSITHNLNFEDLKHPRIGFSATDIETGELVTLKTGSLNKAFKASVAVPGLFAPVVWGKHILVDGGLVNVVPTLPVKQMGADIVIAVDLYNREKKISGPEVKENKLANELRKKFIDDELLNLKNYLFPDFWPKAVKKILRWAFDKLVYPARVLKIMAGREPPEITKVMYEALMIITNNFARERMEHADIQFRIRPAFDGLDWLDFDKVDKMIVIGEKAMEKELPRLKRMLNKQD